MNTRFKSFLYALPLIMTFMSLSCKKGTFDINTNPNVPVTVNPQLILSYALSQSAAIAAGNPGDGSTSGTDILDCYMGYWAISGDYSPNSSTLNYHVTTDFGASNWDMTYPLLKNYKNIENYYTGKTIAGANYLAIAKIMKAYHIQRLVDMYNNIPYSKALNGETSTTPGYDDAKTVYKSLVAQLDTAISLIDKATSASDDPGKYDGVYAGDMAEWQKLANSIKLRLLLNLTKTSDGDAFIKAELKGLVTDDFIGTGDDAAENPGYSNGSTNQQNPLWQDIGYTPTGGKQGNTAYFRANAYAVSFYNSTNDPRVSLFYTVNGGGKIKGRVFGSTALEHNADISSIGGNPDGAVQTSGLLASPKQSAYLFSAAESYFLLAEAVQRNYLAGNASDFYVLGVTESFNMLGVPDYETAATTYVAQPGDNTDFINSTDKIKTIITQKWAALNSYNPLSAWNDWRRLGIPADLPVSIYPGTTAPHIPYRFLYPTSEYSYNSANVNAQGTIDAITSKIFWMP